MRAFVIAYGLALLSVPVSAAVSIPLDVDSGGVHAFWVNGTGYPECFGSPVSPLVVNVQVSRDNPLQFVDLGCTTAIVEWNSDRVTLTFSGTTPADYVVAADTLRFTVPNRPGVVVPVRMTVLTGLYGPTGVLGGNYAELPLLQGTKTFSFVAGDTITLGRSGFNGTLIDSTNSVGPWLIAQLATFRPGLQRTPAF